MWLENTPTNTYLGCMYAFTVDPHDQKALMQLCDGMRSIIPLNYRITGKRITLASHWDGSTPKRRLENIESSCTLSMSINRRGIYM